MGDNPTLHVKVIGAHSEEEFKRVREAFRDVHGYQIVITDEHYELSEFPALDDFADELADRVAERIAEVR